MVPNSKKLRKHPRNTKIPYLAPSFDGDVAFTINIESYVNKATTTVTTGLIAHSHGIQAATIDNFAARFAAFDQYKILKATYAVNCIGATNPGVMVMWFEPTSSAVPTNTTAVENFAVNFPASDVSRKHVISYNPRDPVTQIWSPVTTTTNIIGYFKLFTNNASFGSSVTATDYAVITATYQVAFRGYA